MERLNLEGGIETVEAYRKGDYDTAYGVREGDIYFNGFNLTQQERLDQIKDVINKKPSEGIFAGWTDEMAKAQYDE